MLQSRILLCVITIVTTLIWGAAQAQPPAPVTAPAQQDNIDSGQINNLDPLRGLIINRTMTVLGWDFYKSFSQIWQALHPDAEVTLTVTERPTAQFGSEIWVRNQRENTLYHTFLSPARSQVTDASKQAVEIVNENVQRLEAERNAFKSADLAPEEF